MNSNSNYPDKKDKCNKEEKKCCPTVLRCNTNPIPVIFTAATTTATQVGSADICSKNIKNPCTKVDIATNVTLTGAIAAATTFSFQVFKAPCCAPTQTTPVGLPWILKPTAVDIAAGATATTSFAFTVCDCTPSCNCYNRCSCYNNDCFIYTVVATPTVAGAGSVAFRNTTVSLISTCNTCNCCY